MKNKKETITILHICDYAASYRGNFIDSLASIESYHKNVKNFYLFPARAENTARSWIDEMNCDKTVAYIQEENILKNIFLVRKILKKNKINYIVRHFSDYKIDVIIKFLFNSKKVIRFFHCKYITEKHSIKHRMKFILWKNNKLVGVSDAIANEIKDFFPKFSVYSIVNAIHFVRLQKIDDFPQKDGILLLMMGWDHRVKGVDLAIKAVSNLREKYNLILQIVSGFNEEQNKKLAENILGKKVNWIHHLPSTNNIGTYYNASDIFLSPSRKEAFGYANIEAAYCNNSIVLSKVDGQGELQLDGAYWFESENVDDFTKKLEKAIIELNMPEKIKQREKVKMQVEQIYSLEKWSDKLVDLLC